MRIAIAGPPRTGKTTLAASLGVPVQHTDHARSLGWSKASDEISHWFDADAFCIEGVAVLRALRKWRQRNPSMPPPLDRLVMLWHPYVPHTFGQASMAKSIATQYHELEHWLAPVLEQGQGFPPSSSTPNGRPKAGDHPPVPISDAKTLKLPDKTAKAAPKLPRVRGERKFSLATAPERSPEADARAGEIAPIITTSYLQAFERLGGVTGLVRWGRKNPSAFYRTLAAMAPALGRHAKGHGLLVQVAQFAEKTGRVINGAASEAGDDPDPA